MSIDIYGHTFITKEGKTFNRTYNGPFAVYYEYKEKDGWAYLNDSSTTIRIIITDDITPEDITKILARNSNMDKHVRQKLEEMADSGDVMRRCSFIASNEPMTKEESDALFRNIRK